MKGKILLSVLFSLILAFGMLIASCDDGAFPEDPYKDDANKSATDYNQNKAFAYVDFVDSDGESPGDGIPDDGSTLRGKALTAQLAKEDTINGTTYKYILDTSVPATPLIKRVVKQP